MLYVVATPIGNLADISGRAAATLQAVDYIACEDTRHSKLLLQHIGVFAPTISFHAHSNDHRISELIAKMQAGKKVALISDAGTPGLSDPGGLLVKAAHAHGVTVEAIPGPSAVVAALSVSGMSADQFIFYGFLPKKKGRQTLLTALKTEPKTTVFFESPHRILKTLADFRAILGGDRTICVCRELTKQFEEVLVGSLDQMCAEPVREQGEFVLVLEGV